MRFLLRSVYLVSWGDLVVSGGEVRPNPHTTQAPGLECGLPQGPARDVGEATDGGRRNVSFEQELTWCLGSTVSPASSGVSSLVILQPQHPSI